MFSNHLDIVLSNTVWNVKQLKTLLIFCNDASDNFISVCVVLSVSQCHLISSNPNEQFLSCYCVVKEKVHQNNANFNDLFIYILCLVWPERIIVPVCVFQCYWVNNNGHSINVLSMCLFQVQLSLPSQPALRSTVDLLNCAPYHLKFHELNRIVSL